MSSTPMRTLGPRDRLAAARKSVGVLLDPSPRAVAKVRYRGDAIGKSEVVPGWSDLAPRNLNLSEGEDNLKVIQTKATRERFGKGGKVNERLQAGVLGKLRPDIRSLSIQKMAVDHDKEENKLQEMKRSSNTDLIVLDSSDSDRISPVVAGGEPSPVAIRSPLSEYITSSEGPHHGSIKTLAMTPTDQRKRLRESKRVEMRVEIEDIARATKDQYYFHGLRKTAEPLPGQQLSHGVHHICDEEVMNSKTLQNAFLLDVGVPLEEIGNDMPFWGCGAPKRSKFKSVRSRKLSEADIKLKESRVEACLQAQTALTNQHTSHIELEKPEPVNIATLREENTRLIKDITHFACWEL